MRIPGNCLETEKQKGDCVSGAANLSCDSFPGRRSAHRPCLLSAPDHAAMEQAAQDLDLFDAVENVNMEHGEGWPALTKFGRLCAAVQARGSRADNKLFGWWLHASICYSKRKLHPCSFLTLQCDG